MWREWSRAWMLKGTGMSRHTPESGCRVDGRQRLRPSHCMERDKTQMLRCAQNDVRCCVQDDDCSSLLVAGYNRRCFAALSMTC